MQIITQYAQASDAVSASITLPFDIRQKARFKAKLDSGEDIGVTLERGKILRGGDKLQTESGLIVEIKAAPETVSTVSSTDNLLLTRVCYHLGNRHVPLQIGVNANGQGFCRYTHDHVLDDMVKGLGASITVEQAPFEPESGAYSGGGHGHSHSHD